MSNDKPDAFVPLRPGEHIPVNLGGVYPIPGVQPGDVVQVIPPSVRSKRACERCTYWQPPADGSHIGECRAYPPRPHTPRYAEEPRQAKASRTTADYWCGFWRPEL